MGLLLLHDLYFLGRKMGVNFDGLLVQLFSFWARCKTLELVFNIPDVQLFLSNRLCQDPLEKFFGLQRQTGRVWKAASDGKSVGSSVRREE